ncbi:hypothetical protein ACFWOT_34540 [Streptomyces sp. NPDC058440]|uniref:hypothetical protein n=1 Tax=Streptomyces sp. NPDC058440 TaxID=3346501 RepID=UPI0036490322
MKRTVRIVLTAVLVALAACSPPPETEGTSTPRPHVVAGIGGDSLSEAERRYLDDVLEKAPGTKSGVKWRKNAISASKVDLDMIFDGERLTFCEGAPRRDQDSFTAQMGHDVGRFTFIRQEAAREHLC